MLLLSFCPVPAAPSPAIPTPPSVNSAQPEPGLGAAGSQEVTAAWVTCTARDRGRKLPAKRGQSTAAEKPTFGVNPRGPPVKVRPAPHAPPCPPGNRIHNGAGPAGHKDDSCAAGPQPEGPPPAPRRLLNLFIDALALSVA